MINLRVLFITLVQSLGLVVYAMGASDVYVSDFEAPTFNDPVGEVAGTDGWVIDNGISDLSFLVFSWDPDGAGPLAPSQAAGLGGYYDSPGAAGTEVNLTHPVSIGLDIVKFDVNFAVMGPTPSFPGSDTFGFSFKSPTSDLLRIAFEPSTGAGDLELFWYDEAENKHSLVHDILYNGSYQLSIDFRASGVDSIFDGELTGTNTFNFSGTLPGQAGSTLTGIGVDFDVIGNGDSFIVFDNLQVVPEPQTTVLLLIVGLVPYITRRR